MGSVLGANLCGGSGGAGVRCSRPSIARIQYFVKYFIKSIAVRTIGDALVLEERELAEKLQHVCNWGWSRNLEKDCKIPQRGSWTLGALVRSERLIRHVDYCRGRDDHR